MLTFLCLHGKMTKFVPEGMKHEERIYSGQSAIIQSLELPCTPGKVALTSPAPPARLPHCEVSPPSRLCLRVESPCIASRIAAD